MSCFQKARLFAAIKKICKGKKKQTTLKVIVYQKKMHLWYCFTYQYKSLQNRKHLIFCMLTE